MWIQQVWLGSAHPASLFSAPGDSDSIVKTWSVDPEPHAWELLSSARSQTQTMAEPESALGGLTSQPSATLWLHHAAVHVTYPKWGVRGMGVERDKENKLYFNLKAPQSSPRWEHLDRMGVWGMGFVSQTDGTAICALPLTSYVTLDKE